jgi:hypothetical protein
MNFTINDDVYFNPQTKKVLFGRELKALMRLPNYRRPMKSQFIKIDSDKGLPRITRRQLSRKITQAMLKGTV